MMRLMNVFPHTIRTQNALLVCQLSSQDNFVPEMTSWCTKHPPNVVSYTRATLSYTKRHPNEVWYTSAFFGVPSPITPEALHIR